MTFGKRLATYRKERKYSQNKLGLKIGTSGDVIGKYERDEVKPSIDVASKIADALELSLDNLIGKTNIQLDGKLMQRMQEIQNMDDEDKSHILYLIDAVIKNVKLKSLV
jgi:transcriptional regulator with XRE-family HTH domain